MSFFKLENFETKFIIIKKDGSMVQYVSTIRYASIFAEKYFTLVRYAFFVMVRVRYVGALFEFADYKRFMCNVLPSMKIRATVPGEHIV